MSSSGTPNFHTKKKEKEKFRDSLWKLEEITKHSDDSNWCMNGHRDRLRNRLCVFSWVSLKRKETPLKKISTITLKGQTILSVYRSFICHLHKPTLFYFIIIHTKGRIWHNLRTNDVCRHILLTKYNDDDDIVVTSSTHGWGLSLP